MTLPYAPPIDDLALALDVVEAPDVPATVELLAEFGRFCADVLAPLYQAGDQAGVGFDPATGVVTTAPGWGDAYRKLVDAGWMSVSAPPEFGGGGLSMVLHFAMHELLNAANTPFALCPMLTQGAVHMLLTHGSPDQQARYLPRLVTGEWGGTMNLTEPGAGSDVGALVTRAVPAGDGTWRISGQKIFITYGEHDLTDQIVHIVLARVPEAPPGTRGISCFIVPKHVLDDDGEPGERNAVRCIGVEHKMGIHASPTCTLEYDGAVGELIGEPNAGMRYMFTMMNNARLGVGAEGLGIASRAYQGAVAYARERVQGRVAGAEAGEAIIGHPDVRRMLLHMRSHVDAMRLLVLLNARAIDDQSELADLLTPVSKAWCTDVGAEVAYLATQVFGGMGYIRETGVEQLERDVRITSIYEGTNGIQAIDLVTRKLGIDDGKLVAHLLDRMDETVDALDGDLAALRAPLQAGVTALRTASEHLRGIPPEHVRDALAGATPYLRLFGTVAAGWLLAKQALVVRGRDDATEWATAKLAAARYFVTQVVPVATGLLPAIEAGAVDLDAVPASAF